MQNVDEVVTLLREEGIPANLEGMRRFGIDTTHALGIPVPVLRGIARQIKKDHALALQLWDTGIHEARILASMIDDPALVTEAQINTWVKDFASWDVCDQVCGNLFDRTPFAVKKVKEFSSSKKEFIKRAAFSLVAGYATHNKKAEDKVFIAFLAIIDREAWDNRNFVKKAVNWALRGIGKRNAALNKEAIKTAERILLQQTAAAKWIARDALRELTSDAVISRLQAKRKVRTNKNGRKLLTARLYY
ncbi:MAG TPA: DNA alkylation repair protein [Chitinophagaceae bacterium]|nr:DNA alkylation repair protein [Chitinophagaceae bacterium]